MDTGRTPGMDGWYHAEYPSLRPEFVKHASPEAIEVRLRDANERERRAAREVNDLLSLLRQRLDEKERGAWPPVSGEVEW